MILLCAMFVYPPGAVARGSEVRAAQIDEAKLEDMVVFPGIEGPVRVQALRVAARLDPDRPGRHVLSDNIVENLVRARDRNAFWLVSEGRKDYKAISYVFVFTNFQGTIRVLPTRGKYDRGTYLKLPSEYMLYQGCYREYEYEDSPDYFKVTMKPQSEPEVEEGLYQELYHGGVPNFISWAEPVLMTEPLAWKREREMWCLSLVRNPRDIQYGYELWFAKEDFKLVRELITEPRLTKDEDGHEHYDFTDPQVVREIRYTYLDGTEHPTRMSVLEGDYCAAELRFGLVDRFWMLERGTLFSGPERNEFSFWTYGIRVER